MFVVHPFLLVPVLLVPLAAATAFGPARRAGLAGLLALVVCEAGLFTGSQAAFNDFKAIYAPLHVPDSRVLAEVKSPRGLYTLLDDFTERVDTDVTNDMGLLNLPGPPQTFGLYRDGNRIAALPKPGLLDVKYAPATLAALPYALRPKARVLLAGSSGGFRIAEALALGARQVVALEPDPVVLGALRHGLGGSLPLAADPRVTLSPDGPLAAARAGTGFDLVDLSGDFLDSAEANSTAFTAEALAADLAAVDEGGIVSVPVSIRDFPVYALRVLSTARQAPAHRGRRRPGAPCGGVPVRLERAHPAFARAVERTADRRRPGLVRRAVVRRVVLSRHGRGRLPRRHLQRPACRVVRRRGRHLGRRVGRFHRRRGRRRAARRGHPLRGRLRARPGDAGPAGLLRRAAALPSRHRTPPVGDPAAARDRPVGEPGRSGAGRGDRRAGAAGPRSWPGASCAQQAGRSSARWCISPASAWVSCSSRSR